MRMFVHSGPDLLKLQIQGTKLCAHDIMLHVLLVYVLPVKNCVTDNRCKHGGGAVFKLGFYVF